MDEDRPVPEVQDESENEEDDNEFMRNRVKRR